MYCYCTRLVGFEIVSFDKIMIFIYTVFEGRFLINASFLFLNRYQQTRNFTNKNIVGVHIVSVTVMIGVKQMVYQKYKLAVIRLDWEKDTFRIPWWMLKRSLKKSWMNSSLKPRTWPTRLEKMFLSERKH